MSRSDQEKLILGFIASRVNIIMVFQKKVIKSLQVIQNATARVLTRTDFHLILKRLPLSPSNLFAESFHESTRAPVYHYLMFYLFLLSFCLSFIHSFIYYSSNIFLNNSLIMGFICTCICSNCIASKSV